MANNQMSQYDIDRYIAEIYDTEWETEAGEADVAEEFRCGVYGWQLSMGTGQCGGAGTGHRLRGRGDEREQSRGGKERMHVSARDLEHLLAEEAWTEEDVVEGGEVDGGHQQNEQV